jgi:hypothetical protein
MQALIDDDEPRRPDPFLDDLASAQARRALQKLSEERQASAIERLPVVSH